MINGSALFLIDFISCRYDLRLRYEFDLIGNIIWNYLNPVYDLYIHVTELSNIQIMK